MSEEEQSYYELLGVDPQVAPDELKSAFHELAQKYHPDKGGIDVEHVELFKRITEAYRVLSDPERRNQYNKEQGFQFHEEVSIGGMGGINFPKSSAGPQKKSVDLGGQQRDWSHLRQEVDSDLKVDHKVAMTPEEEMESYRQSESDIGAWGEDGELNGGVFKRRKAGQAARRAELKKNLKETIAEENQPGEPTVAPEMPQRPTRPLASSAESRVENPLSEERVFNFQISALEAALGTGRELVLPGGGERLNKLEFDVPPGIESGTVMEVSRGWDRAKVRITVVQDPLFIVDDLDVHLRIPVTLKEALDGAEITVPGVDNVARVQLRAGASATEVVRVPEMGIASEGDLFVKPFVVAPMQITDTLRAVAKVVDQHSSGSVRQELEANPSDSRFVRNDPDKISVFLPITFTEAISGAEIKVPLLDTSVTVRIPNPWNYAEEIVSSELFDSHGKVVSIFPEIVCPERSSDDLQGAALAIDQHHLKHPRAHLPRTLKNAR